MVFEAWVRLGANALGLYAKQNLHGINPHGIFDNNTTFVSFTSCSNVLEFKSVRPGGLCRHQLHGILLRYSSH